MRPWSLDFYPSVPETRLIQWPVKAKCSLQWIIYLFIHSSLQTQSGSEQQPTRTSSNSAPTDNKQIGSVNPPGSAVTSLSSMRFNLCLMSRLMAACLRNFSENSFMKNRLCWIWVSETQIQAGCPKNITYHRCFYTSAEKLKWGDSRVRISLL